MTRAKQAKPQSLEKRNARMGYLMVSPIVIGILAFTVYPVIFSLFISFTDWDMIKPFNMVGIENYVTMFTSRMFSTVWTNTLKYVIITVPGSIFFGLLLALALNSKRVRGAAFFRTAFFLPNITTTVAVCVVWMWLYDKNYGFINNILVAFGLEPVSWLTSRSMAMPSISIMSIWQNMGYDMVIIAAGLKSIDETYYEAANIDGASKWQSFWKITLPMLTPTLFFLVVMHFISFFQLFDAAFVMTSGGPGHATRTVVMQIYDTAFTYFRMGEAAAYAWVLFFVIFIITGVQFALQKKWVNYDA